MARVMTEKQLLRSTIGLTLLALSVGACGDDEDGGGGTGGVGATGGIGATGGTGATGGVGATGGTGGSTGGTGGSTGGTGGSTGGTGGATGGTGGATGGTGGGMAGSAGAAGMAGSAGMAGAGGGITETIYDFEQDEQGWTAGTDVTVAVSTEQALDGSQSLAITLPGLDEANGSVQVDSPPIWPGMEVTLNLWLPEDFPVDDMYAQAFLQGNNYQDPPGFYIDGNAGNDDWVAGAWNSWTFTVPDTVFPGGTQVLGIQVGDGSGDGTIAAGTVVYLDAITVSGGSTECAIDTGTGDHDFEGETTDAYAIDEVGGVAPTDTAIALSTDQASSGTQSLAVTFTDLPAPDEGEATVRQIYVNHPAIYCGQQVTLHVYLPTDATATGADALTFAGYTHYDWFGSTEVAEPPATIDRGAFTEYTFSLPTDVGPQGIQRVGARFEYSGAAPFSGTAYIDQITW